MKNIKIKSVLISVFNKEGLDELCRFFFQNQIDIFSTGGTEKYIKSLKNRENNKNKKQKS